MWLLWWLDAFRLLLQGSQFSCWVVRTPSKPETPQHSLQLGGPQRLWVDLFVRVWRCYSELHFNLISGVAISLLNRFFNFDHLSQKQDLRFSQYLLFSPSLPHLLRTSIGEKKPTNSSPVACSFTSRQLVLCDDRDDQLTGTTAVQAVVVNKTSLFKEGFENSNASCLDLKPMICWSSQIQIIIQQWQRHQLFLARKEKFKSKSESNHDGKIESQIDSWIRSIDRSYPNWRPTLIV